MNLQELEKQLKKGTIFCLEMFAGLADIIEAVKKAVEEVLGKWVLRMNVLFANGYHSSDNCTYSNWYRRSLEKFCLKLDLIVIDFHCQHISEREVVLGRFISGGQSNSEAYRI